MDTGEHRERYKRLVPVSVKLITEYRDTFDTNIAGLLLDVASALEQAEQVFIAGNGGSAASAIHLASDLRTAGVSAISLCENISVVTRLANDEGYAKVFIRQMQELDFGGGLLKRDVLVLISASGDSLNIIEAACYARMVGAIVVGLIGFGGGKLKALCDYDITLESRDYGVVEGLHSCFCHIIPQLIKEIRSVHAETGNA